MINIIEIDVISPGHIFMTVYSFRTQLEYNTRPLTSLFLSSIIRYNTIGSKAIRSLMIIHLYRISLNLNRYKYMREDPIRQIKIIRVSIKRYS